MLGLLEYDPATFDPHSQVLASFEWELAVLNQVLGNVEDHLSVVVSFGGNDALCEAGLGL